MKLTDEECATVRQAMAGDLDAFDALVIRFARLVYAQSFTILHDREEAEDVVQEAFVKAYSFRLRLLQPERFPQWLLAIARNVARDHLRRRHPGDRDRGSGVPEAVEGLGPSPLRAAEIADDVARLQAALGTLPKRYRRALLLRYVEGLDHRALRREMGVSDGALRGILGRALGRLRRVLAPPGARVRR
ncbi:MAG: sigma-70 family RNA polymerase sigma factor [Lentisphaeria bacterium]|nr:sigma-70 family RNA polymerase sigma factor [Lentisphaeria bacterium]